ncbi:MAG: helix-turn-helix domain-containing protein [Lachnospiraceae bacterium]|nr:helix-turn-helix domain-containing protein [Lachnospiraceae bacterium]
MISNQILQNTIEGLKGISRVDFAVVDTDGKDVVSTLETDKGYISSVEDFVKSPADSQEVSRYQFFKIYDDQVVEYVLVAIGLGEDVYMVGKMAAFQIQSLLVAYKERFDKDNFIKNLLLDNLLLVDIYSRSKKLHIRTEAKRAVLIVESDQGKESNVMEHIHDYLGLNNMDFVTAVDENNVIIVKELQEQDVIKELNVCANSIVELLEKEGATEVRVSYGNVVGEIKEVSRSYKEAKMALDVGKIFFDERNVVAYSELGIGRLIYQLPIPLCKMFIKEIFAGKSPDDFDEETLVTIHKFFENSLNVSETSRQLFIHRNTLVYRLDKLQKSTGLDLRVFEDAITFKIALMVVKYMKYMESFEY